MFVCVYNFKFTLNLSLNENLRKATIYNYGFKLKEFSINSDPITSYASCSKFNSDFMLGL